MQACCRSFESSNGMSEPRTIIQRVTLRRVGTQATWPPITQLLGTSLGETCGQRFGPSVRPIERGRGNRDRRFPEILRPRSRIYSRTGVSCLSTLQNKRSVSREPTSKHSYTLAWKMEQLVAVSYDHLCITRVPRLEIALVRKLRWYSAA